MIKARVLIANNHKLIRESISLLIGSDENMQVVAEADCGDKAVEISQKLLPDMIVIDTDIQGLNCEQVIRLVLGMDLRTKFICLSSTTDLESAKRIFQLGAMGILSRYASSTDLMICMKEVSLGRKYMCSQIKADFLNQFLKNDTERQKRSLLTKREQQIIAFINKGLSSKEIASILALSVKTIEAHRYNIFKKLDIKKVTALASYSSHKITA